jgi:hypothetical protein
MVLRGEVWAYAVISDLESEKKLSPADRKTLALEFAEMGRYTESAKQVLRDYAKGI